MTETITKALPEMVTVTVNGEERQLPKGKNLLHALLDGDTHVPHYCWHPSLSIAGNCRLCLIEIEGQPRPSVACNMTCSDGLKIQTESEMAHDAREGMMEFLLQNHPLDCPVCDRGGECMLQRYSVQHGIGSARTVDERRRFEKPEFDPLIDIERNRCIMCTRCVRFTDEVAGEHVMGVFGHGDRNYIGTEGNGPVSNIFSGNVIDLCPVGCLTSKPFRFKARAWELQQVGSTCTLCSQGCPTTAWIRDGAVYRVTPPVRRYAGTFTIDEDTTKFICNEGRFGNYYANSADRLKSAIRDDDGSHVISTLDEALDIAVGALKDAAEAGPDQVAILAGSRATNEEYFLLSQIARGALGTNQLDARTDYVTSYAARAASIALGASDGDIEGLERGDYEVTVVIDAPLLESIPVTGLKIKEAVRAGKTRLVTLGSRADGWLSKFASAGAVSAPESLAADISKIAKGLGKATPKKKTDLNVALDILKGAKSGLIVLGLDVAGGAFNADRVPAALALLNKLGGDWKFLPVFRGRNTKGAFASGAISDRPLGADAPGDAANPEPGPTASEILQRAADGKIKTLLLHRCDDLVGHPNRALVLKALEATENVIAIDIFPSLITQNATVVLPGALFFETEGSMVSCDGTLQALSPANQPPGDAQEDWKILAALGEALGLSMPYRSASNIFAELLQAWGGPTRMRYSDLRLEGPGAESPQRPQPPQAALIRKKTRPDFKLHYEERNSAADFSDASAGGQASADELRLFWYHAIQGQDHLGSRSAGFAELRPEAKIEMNSSDIEKSGFAEGDIVQVSGCKNAVQIVANDSLPAGVAYGAANVLGLELESRVGGEAGALPRIELSRPEEPE